MADEPSSAMSTYLHFRQIFGDPSMKGRDAKARRTKSRESVPYGVGREPKGIADVLDSLTNVLGWNSPLARADLLEHWVEICGAETAQHAEPLGIEEGVLTVRCSSTAWATQLRLMRAEVLGQITIRFPEAGVEEVRFLAPNAPSWKRGPRTIPGRGPRDTYG
jgi:predicted nucleic acid-binding Zn ribbon protein